MLALVASCYYSHHTTHVREGWHGSIEAGAAHSTKQDGAEPPARQTGFDLLGTLGYGWRFDRVGLLGEVVLPVSRFYMDLTPKETAIYPSIHFFIQRDDVINYGAGISAGYIPSAYAQAGKSWRIDRCNAWSVDGGIAALLAPSTLTGPAQSFALGAFALATREVAGIDIGAWVDVIRYSQTTNVCSDCEDAFARYRMAAGLSIRGVLAPKR